MENIVEQGRPQKTIWFKRIACWIPKDTDAHSQYVMLVVFPLQQWVQEGAAMLRYKHITRLVNLYVTGTSHIKYEWMTKKHTLAQSETQH